MALNQLIGLGIIICIFIISTGLKKIEEGYVGVVYYLGRLQTYQLEPGFHLTVPLLSVVEDIQVNVQTDKVTDVPCGTKGGVMINFGSIEVVNKLEKQYVYKTVKDYGSDYDQIWIYDKIHHEINQFCSKNSLEDIYIRKFELLDEELIQILTEQLEKWVPGLSILSIRITKPTVPEQIRVNFERQEAVKAQLYKKVMIQEQDSKLQQQLIQANSSLEIKKIEMDKLIKQKENELELQRIKNQMYLSSQKSLVDGQFYSEEKELELIEQKLTDQYLQTLMVQSLTSNVELNIGSKIPQYINFNKN